MGDLLADLGGRPVDLGDHRVEDGGAGRDLDDLDRSPRRSPARRPRSSVAAPAPGRRLPDGRADGLAPRGRGRARPRGERGVAPGRGQRGRPRLGPRGGCAPARRPATPRLSRPQTPHPRVGLEMDLPRPWPAQTRAVVGRSDREGRLPIVPAPLPPASGWAWRSPAGSTGRGGRASRRSTAWSSSTSRDCCESGLPLLPPAWAPTTGG